MRRNREYAKMHNVDASIKRMKGIIMKKDLSPAEELIMRAVWAFEHDPDLPILTEYLKEEYGKEYARTSMVTFLLRLSNKGFVETYRKGRLSYVHALKSEDEYRVEVAKKDMNFWFKGGAVSFLSTLHSYGRLTEEDRQKIKEYLDELDRLDREDNKLDH